MSQQYSYYGVGSCWRYSFMILLHFQPNETYHYSTNTDRRAYGTENGRAVTINDPVSRVSFLFVLCIWLFVLEGTT
jgi:hypothetical protein